MPRSQTSKKILNIAERNIMRSGYSAWSYHHIARELELKPAAIHYHYRTKSELVVAVVERYGCRFDAWARSVTGFEPAEQLAAYFEVGRHFVDRELVCTLVMLNTHREAIPAEVREATRAVQGRIMAFFQRNLAAGREAGQLEFAGTPEDAATTLVGAVVGAQHMARAFGPEAYDSAVRQLSLALKMSGPVGLCEGHLPASGDPPCGPAADIGGGCPDDRCPRCLWQAAG